MTKLRTLLRSTRAATAIEYGLIVSLIFLAGVGAMQGFGGRAMAMWNNVSNAMK